MTWSGLTSSGLGCAFMLGTRLELRGGTVKTVSRTSSDGSARSSSASMWMLNSSGDPRDGIDILAVGSGTSDTLGEGIGAGGIGV